MHISSVRLSGMLVLGFLLGGGAAQAGFLNYSYHWSISPAPVLASGTGTVAMALGRGGIGGSRDLAMAVTTSSSASARRPDHFYKTFSLTMHLTDRAEHLSGNLTFHGTVIGTLSSHSAYLIERFSTPLESIRLGNHIYHVRLPSAIWLAPPGSSHVPTIYATVWDPLVSPQPLGASTSIHTSSVPGGAGSAPEPSALVLAGLGAALAVAVGVWRCRRPHVAMG
ncbi:MAG TPA: hypothetical protein VH643_15180 [Gemmataceae bacterium]|jgi:hypothetical protein